MNRKWKSKIQSAFDIPDPDQAEKEHFLGTLPAPRIRMKQFIISQAAFFRKRTIILSLLLLVPALAGSHYFDKNSIWAVSALVPFLALLAVSECACSAVYGMSEIEMSTRFSLKSLTLARLILLGILDFIILCCMIPLCCASSRFTLFQAGIYLFVPYLLTANFSLWITRHIQGRESLYGCMSAAVLVSGANIWLHFMADFIYQLSCFRWWVLFIFILIVITIYEIRYTFKKTEEYAWNLLSTD